MTELLARFGCELGGEPLRLESLILALSTKELSVLDEERNGPSAPRARVLLALHVSLPSDGGPRDADAREWFKHNLLVVKFVDGPAANGQVKKTELALLDRVSHGTSFLAPGSLACPNSVVS